MSDFHPWIFFGMERISSPMFIIKLGTISKLTFLPVYWTPGYDILYSLYLGNVNPKIEVVETKEGKNGTLTILWKIDP